MNNPRIQIDNEEIKVNHKDFPDLNNSHLINSKHDQDIHNSSLQSLNKKDPISKKNKKNDK